MSTEIPKISANSSVFAGIRANLMLALLLPTLLMTSSANADNGRNTGLEDNGALDVPWVEVSRHEGVSSVSISKSEAEKKKKALKAAVKLEAKQLRKLSDKKLRKKATAGDRVAQLLLAETNAKEGQTNSLTIGAANDALGEALYWYSLAAKRGYPGAPSIDGLLATPPIRVVKGP